jgi:hypothetical protein
VNSEFWHSDDDFAVLARYLAEHTYDAGMRDGMFVIEVGDGDLVPTVEARHERSVCARVAAPSSSTPRNSTVRCWKSRSLTTAPQSSP